MHVLIIYLVYIFAWLMFFCLFFIPALILSMFLVALVDYLFNSRKK